MFRLTNSDIYKAAQLSHIYSYIVIMVHYFQIWCRRKYRDPHHSQGGLTQPCLRWNCKYYSLFIIVRSSQSLLWYVYGLKKLYFLRVAVVCCGVAGWYYMQSYWISNTCGLVKATNFVRKSSWVLDILKNTHNLIFVSEIMIMKW